MSSRLFQSLRERRGLCYAVYSFSSAYLDTGLNAVYAALSPEQETAAIIAILEELRRLREEGVTEEELSRAREQVKANALMSLESTSARMNRLGRNALIFEEIPPLEQIIDRYKAVSREELLELARRSFDMEQISLSAVGRVRPAAAYGEVIAGF